MKLLIKSTFILCVLFSLVSCSEDDTSPNKGSSGSVDSNASIEGEWTFNSFTVTDGTVAVNGENVSTYTAESSNETGTWRFNTGNTFQSRIGYTLDVSLLTSGTVSSTSETIAPTTVGGSFSHDQSGNKVTITILPAEDQTVYTVTELTDSKLTLTTNTSSTEEQDGEQTTTTGTTTFFFTK